jgi:hypothetical protein
MALPKVWTRTSWVVECRLPYSIHAVCHVPVAVPVVASVEPGSTTPLVPPPTSSGDDASIRVILTSETTAVFRILLSRNVSKSYYSITHQSPMAQDQEQEQILEQEQEKGQRIRDNGSSRRQRRYIRTRGNSSHCQYEHSSSGVK